MKCYFAALLPHAYLTQHTAEGHWNCNKLHLKSEDFVDDVPRAKLKQVFGKKHQPIPVTCVPWGQHQSPQTSVPCFMDQEASF